MHGAEHLSALLARGARANPDRPALVFDGVAQTHAELHDRAARIATGLAARGVHAGDRVAMVLHNGLEFPETLLACLRLGAIAVPINFRLTRAEIDYILTDAAAATLVDGPLSADHEPAPQAAGLAALPRILLGEMPQSDSRSTIDSASIFVSRS